MTYFKSVSLDLRSTIMIIPLDRNSVSSKFPSSVNYIFFMKCGPVLIFLRLLSLFRTAVETVHLIFRFNSFKRLLVSSEIFSVQREISFCLTVQVWVVNLVELVSVLSNCRKTLFKFRSFYLVLAETTR